MMAVPASPAPLEAGKINGMRIIESEEDSNTTHPSKLDKEPLLESIYQEVTGGGSVKSLSPYRLMQASKTTLLCCLYMGIGTSPLKAMGGLRISTFCSILFLILIDCMSVSYTRSSKPFMRAFSTFIIRAIHSSLPGFTQC